MTVQLHYQSYGNGMPLFILHGLFGSGRNWSGIAQQLANEFQVITVDLRNHGESGHADTMGYHEMAEDIVALAGSLGIEKFNLLGHSLGGKTAMVVSLLYPELINKLIIIDIAPVNYQSNHDQLILAMLSIEVNQLKNRRHAEELLSGKISDPHLRQFLLQNLVRENNTYKWRINLDAIQKNHQHLRQFPKNEANLSFDRPALFLSGSLSDYVRPEHEKTIRTYFPNHEHRVIENANHWVHADKPGEVVEEVRKFLGH